MHDDFAALYEFVLFGHIYYFILQSPSLYYYSLLCSVEYEHLMLRYAFITLGFLYIKRRNEASRYTGPPLTRMTGLTFRN